MSDHDAVHTVLGGKDARRAALSGNKVRVKRSIEQAQSGNASASFFHATSKLM